jgi:hypothetical protein
MEAKGMSEDEIRQTARTIFVEGSKKAAETVFDNVWPELSSEGGYHNRGRKGKSRGGAHQRRRGPGRR